MSTGLFSNRTATSQGLGARAHQRKLRRADIREFAGLLAEHGIIARAAREMGVPQAYGTAMFKTIRAELGWQAI